MYGGCNLLCATPRSRTMIDPRWAVFTSASLGEPAREHPAPQPALNQWPVGFREMEYRAVLSTAIHHSYTPQRDPVALNVAFSSQEQTCTGLSVQMLPHVSRTLPHRLPHQVIRPGPHFGIVLFCSRSESTSKAQQSPPMAGSLFQYAADYCHADSIVL